MVAGSATDQPLLDAAAEVLRRFEVKFEMKIRSAHRTPEATRDYVLDAQRRGCRVFIAIAGMAAHLAGAVAATTIRPVIGVPAGGGVGGLDSLLSTVQMPAGIPVATVAIGKAGGRNAAYLAVQMLALEDAALASRLEAVRREEGEKILALDQES